MAVKQQERLFLFERVAGRYGAPMAPMRLASREKVEWAFDVEFTFNATGNVLTRLPK